MVQVYLGEFDYLFRARGAPLPLRHRVGACVASDTADTVYQSGVELNRSKHM